MDLDEFLSREVYPALHRRLDAAFPEFGWRRRGDAWVATEEAATRRLPGAPRPDRVYVYANRPWGMVIQGGGFVRWLRYLNGGAHPSGPDFVEAVRRLAAAAGLRLPERDHDPDEVDRLQRRHARSSVLETAAALFQEVLRSDRGAAARAYLAQRGLGEEAIQALGLGLYPEPSEVARALREAGADPDAVREAAILWERLEGYLIFPWADAAGQPQTLYGRWPADPVPGHLPKHLGLPGEGTKASPLYLDRARQAGCKDLVLVEGLLDAAVAQARGDPRVVACMAARLSAAQVATLRRHQISSVTICLDPDGAGEGGTLACVEDLARAGITSYVAPPVPDGLDPDTFILRDGMDAWRGHVAGADHAFRFRAKALLASFADPEGEPAWTDKALAGCLDAALAFDAKVTDPSQLPALEAFFWPEILDRTGLSAEAVKARRTELRDRLRAERARRAGEDLLRRVQGLAEDGDLEGATDELDRGLRRIRVAQGRTAPEPYLLDHFLRDIREVTPGLATGWGNLDRVVRVPEGAMTIVAGRPSHGKTTVLLNLLANLLRAYPEQRFAFFSYEEAKSRLALKLIMILADQVLRNGDNQAATLELLQGEAAFDNRAVEAAKQQFGTWTSSGRLLLSDKRLAAEDLAGTIGHLHEEQGLGGCFVDYIQKIPVLRPASQRYLDVKRASELLLEQAVRTNVPLVLGAQLGRPAGGRGGSAVRLDNLRESGDIEQDANVVVGIWNKAVNVDVEAEQDEVEKEWRGADSDLMVAVLKNRNGRAGVKEYLAFNRDTLRLSGSGFVPRQHQEAKLRVVTSIR